MELLAITSVLAALVGLLLLIILPMFERSLGPQYMTGAILVGVLLELVALSTGVAAFEHPIGKTSVIASVAMLVWSLVSYLIFEGVRARVRGERSQLARSNQNPGAQSGECEPKLVLGERKLYSDEDKYGNWRSCLYFVHSTVSPTDGGMPLKNWAWGGAYYGLWYRYGTPEAKAELKIKCYLAKEEEPCRDENCKIVGSIEGPTEAVDSIVRVSTAVQLKAEGNTLEAQVVMGAALSASGGPKITLGKEGVAGLELEWPDATYAAVNNMGTYVWKCKCRRG